jgi:HD-like signal output (HDOD) protein
MQQETPVATDTRLEFLKDFADQLVSRDIDLPPFPDVYARILNALNDPDLSMDQLARVVTAAPDLCVRILLLANSALMNRAGVEVTDINVAVSRLGVSTVRNAAVALATKEVFDIPKGSSLQLKLDQLRAASVKTAAYAYALANRAGLISLKDNAMLAGLLHNVGSFYILSKADKYPEFAEEAVMQSWGPSIGYAIIENWGFPEELAKAVEEQDILEATHLDPSDLRDLLIVGKRLARFSEQEEMETQVLEEDGKQIAAFGKLDINADNLERVLEEIGEEVESFVSALK